MHETSSGRARDRRLFAFCRVSSNSNAQEAALDLLKPALNNEAEIEQAQRVLAEVQSFYMPQRIPASPHIKDDSLALVAKLHQLGSEHYTSLLGFAFAREFDGLWCRGVQRSRARLASEVVHACGGPRPLPHQRLPVRPVRGFLQDDSPFKAEELCIWIPCASLCWSSRSFPFCHDWEPWSVHTSEPSGQVGQCPGPHPGQVRACQLRRRPEAFRLLGRQKKIRGF